MGRACDCGSGLPWDECDCGEGGPTLSELREQKEKESEEFWEGEAPGIIMILVVIALMLLVICSIGRCDKKFPEQKQEPALYNFEDEFRQAEIERRERERRSDERRLKGTYGNMNEYFAREAEEARRREKQERIKEEQRRNQRRKELFGL